MRLSFLGATGTVTGSKYLLTLNTKKILIDCGLFQGEQTLRERNWATLPVAPHEINAVILTHAHLDHSGYLPLLIKNGFSGPIFATPGTKKLCEILLPDSGRLQEEDAYFANKHHYSRHGPALPLYTEEDAKKALKYFSTIPFETSHSLFDATFIFSKAAHILGAAFVSLQFQGTTLVFSGDLGRSHDPIMQQPTPLKHADYLVIESTYGDRLHDKQSPSIFLEKIINETVARKGTVVIPAFAVGRTQSILYYLSLLRKNNRIPAIPIFLDSPMAESVTDVYNPHYCDHPNSDVTYITTVEDSKKLDHSNEPAIIISASGMAEGGRVLHHIKNFAPDPRNTLLFTGYQAKGTLGEQITSGVKEIKIHGEKISVLAQVSMLSNLSAHADYAETLLWLEHLKHAPRHVFVTHGEPAPALSLKQKIEEKFGWLCSVPEYLQTVELK